MNKTPLLAAAILTLLAVGGCGGPKVTIVTVSPSPHDGYLYYGNEAATVIVSDVPYAYIETACEEWFIRFGYGHVEHVSDSEFVGKTPDPMGPEASGGWCDTYRWHLTRVSKGVRITMSDNPPPGCIGPQALTDEEWKKNQQRKLDELKDELSEVVSNITKD